MNVAELIEKLKKMPQDAVVVYPDCSNDGQAYPEEIERVEAPQKHPDWENWKAFASKVILW